jgi:hypothetical protein
MMVLLLNLIFNVSYVLAWVLVLTGALVLASILFSLLYLVLKRLGSNLIGQAAMMNFLTHYYSVKLKKSRFVRWIIK